MALPAGVRPARGGDARDARRPHGDAGRVGQALAGGRAGARDPDGRRLPDRGAAREHDRAAARRSSSSGRTRRRCSSRTRARRARRPSRARSSASPTWRPRCASWSRPSSRRSRRARAARRRSRPPTTASTRATSRRSWCAACASRAGLITAGGPGRAGRCASRSRCSTSYKGIEVYKLTVWTQGPAMLQALNILENVDLKAHGLQQRALRPHASTRR